MLRAIIVLLIAAAALLAPAAADAATRPTFVVLGAPDADDGRGALVVSKLEEPGRPRTYTAQDLGLPASEPGDHFGAAVTQLGLAGDVVVGAPGREGRGAVYLVRSTASGRLGAKARNPSSLLGRTSSRLLGTGFAAGDRYGASVAASQQAGYRQHLWVGAPGRRGGQGEVTHRLLDRGRPAGSVATFVPSTTAVPGAAGDFGAVLVATPSGALAGLPDADDARGAVLQLRLSRTAATGATAARRPAPRFGTGEGRRLTLPGAQPGDRFGAALSRDGGDGSVNAGAPGVDARDVPDAGAIAPLGPRGVKRVIPAPRPVPGGAFGAAVVTSFTFYEQSYIDTAVLSPGARTLTYIGRSGDDGTVVTVPFDATRLGVAAPDYTEEDREDAVVGTDASGHARITAYGRGFDDSRTLDVATPLDKGALIPPIPYVD